jgi:aquaporin related protein
MYISLSFGLGLLVTAWVFYRVTGALFNPAITFALWLIGGLTAFRAVLLVTAQLLGGIAASALIAGLTPFGGIELLRNTLGNETTTAQGLFIEVSVACRHVE